MTLLTRSFRQTFIVFFTESIAAGTDSSSILQVGAKLLLVFVLDAIRQKVRSCQRYDDLFSPLTYRYAVCGRFSTIPAPMTVSLSEMQCSPETIVSISGGNRVAPSPV